MSWDGMLPEGVTCQKCGKVLNEDGDYPAERYLGTYNGLCYACTGAEPFVTEDIEDGFKCTSHPPSCPSWRRDRESYVWHPDCGKCKMGAVVVSQPLSAGGPYKKQCEECMDGWWNGPSKTAEREREAQEEAQFRQTFGELCVGSYAVAMKDGVREVKGHLFNVPRFPYTRFGVRSEKRDYWVVSELLSGLRVASGTTKEKALDSAASGLHRHSRRAMARLIVG